MSEFSIEVSSLSKHFMSTQALVDVSFRVPKGSIFGFLGPNGAGKTTTIRCMMDFIRPNGGSIKILGKDSQADSAELKQDIGFLSSDMQLNLNWTGDDHLDFFQSIKGHSPDRQKLVELFDLNTKIKVKNLSTGNQQKLSIILSMMGNPKVLLMDEPTRGLDPMLQQMLYDVLKDFVSTGRTVFFSSHNLDEVQRICDTVALIKNGKIVADMSMSDILDMKMHLISATSSKPFKLNELTLPGVKVLAHDTKHIDLSVQGDINPVIQILSKHRLADLSVGHASLEDVFLEQYRS